MLLLCLIAAMAGTPLRQAEAAGDLARSLAELDDGAVAEEIDGGIGDDSGEAIVRAGEGSGSWRVADAPSPIDGIPIAPMAVGSALPRDWAYPGCRPASRAAADSCRRYAWLHRFLF
jgi:hypothetical protein